MSDSVLVTLTRGSVPESEHRGAYCVVEGGRVVRRKGDIERCAFLRSAAKPFQALTVVESGACDHFGFDRRELALVMGSHDGSPMHAQMAAGMLEKVGVSPDLLRCGGHTPLSREVAERYIREGYERGRLEDNCSGKHAGMMAAAKMMDADVASYAEPDHPVQRRNLEQVARFSGVPPGEIRIATDGCAVPTFGIPVRAMAAAAARFGTPEGFDDETQSCVRRILDAVTAHPEMVAGPKRFDTKMMRAAPGRLFVKMGAEGVLLAGVIGGSSGIAVKILDGRERALHAVMAVLLADAGLVNADDIADQHPRVILSREGDPVGEVQVNL